MSDSNKQRNGSELDTTEMTRREAMVAGAALGIPLWFWGSDSDPSIDDLGFFDTHWVADDNEKLVIDPPVLDFANNLTVEETSEGVEISVDEESIGDSIGDTSLDEWAEDDDGTLEGPALSTEDLRTEELPTVDVDAFGAEGDGETDDSAAIQAAVDSVPDGEKRILSFSPGGRYRLDSTVQVDADNIREIRGNRAHIKLTSDVPAFHITGRKDTTGGSRSNEPNEELVEEEMMTGVTGLQIYSEGGTDIGVGLRITETYATAVHDCLLMRLRTGVEYTSINRNLLVYGCHIGYTSDHGIHFDGGNMHQAVIGDTLISDVGGHSIFIDDGDYADFHIANCNIEFSGDNMIHIDINEDNGNNMYYMLVSNCNFQHVGNAWSIAVTHTGPTGPTNQIHGISVVGCDFESGDRHFNIEKCDQLNIVGNHFRTCGTQNIILREHVNSLNISNNNFWGGRGTIDRQAVVWIWNQEDNPMEDINITNNVLHEYGGNFVYVAGRDVTNLRVSGNVVGYGDDNLDSMRAEQYAIELDGVSNLEYCSVTNNHIHYAGDDQKNGIRVDATNMDGLIVKDNIVANAVDAFDLPAEDAGNIIVSDNLDR